MSSLVTKEAPDFTAQAVNPDNSISDFTLSSLRGKYVVLFFYPLDFTFVCPSEIIAFDKKVKEFKDRNAELVGVSVEIRCAAEPACKTGLPPSERLVGRPLRFWSFIRSVPRLVGDHLLAGVAQLPTFSSMR